MATQRIESGRVQMAGVSGVPMTQITPRQIDYTTAANVQAQGASQLAQLVDRMSQSAFQTSAEMFQLAAVEDVARSQLTAEDLEMAKKGDLSSLNLGSPLNVYDATVRKARAFQLASAFEQEAKSEAVKILSDVKNSNLSSEDAAKKLNSITSGFTASVAQADGEAALKFSASMKGYSHTVMAEAYKFQRERETGLRTLKAQQGYMNTMELVRADLEQGFFTDANGVQQSVDMKIAKHLESVQQEAFDAQGINYALEVGKNFNQDVKELRIDVATGILLTEEYMRDPEKGMERVLAGDLGRFSAVWGKMDEADKKAVRDNYAAAIKARKEGIELSLGESQRQGDNILRNIYLAPNVGEMNNLFKQLNGLPVSPSTISQARTFIRTMSTEGRASDDLAAFGRVTQRIALGLATQDEIISGPFTNATKRTLIGQQSNPGNAINAGVTRINAAVNIQSADLPPEFADASSRELAVRTRSSLTQQLYDFARTPDANGRLPDNTALTKKGEELAAQAKASMSSAFGTVATTKKNSAVMMVPELSGVDLMDEAAVAAAFAKATARKRDPNHISSARTSVDDYRKNMRQVEGQK